MNKMRQWLGLAYLLLPSLACSGLGIWLIYHSILDQSRTEGEIGFVLLFGGMTVVPLALALLGNKFLRTERERLRIPRSRRSLQTRIKSAEKQLRYGYFLQRHPITFPLFCLMALIVSAAMLFASTAKGGTERQIVFLHVTGIVIGMFYAGALIFFCYASLTGKWQPYMDASIRKMEERLTRMREEQVPPQSQENSGTQL